MTMQQLHRAVLLHDQVGTVQIIDFRSPLHLPILAEPKGGSGGGDGWAHNKEPLSGEAMTYTFKLARRLARLRAGALLASFLTVACAGGDSPSGPESDPIPNDPTAIDIYPDTATVGVDGTVQFDAQEAPLDQTSASYRWWRRKHQVVSVTVDPDSVKLAPGASRTFNATGKTSYGSYVRLQLLWKATGGTVSDSGTYVAGKTPGKYIVVATTSTGLADTAQVDVTGPTGGTTTRRVVLTPQSVTLPRGGQQRFSLTGMVSDSSSFSVNPSYQGTGGTVSDSGMFTAGQTPGTYRVIATDRGTGLADTSSVTLVDGDNAVASVTVSPASASLTEGQTKQLSATVRDQAGNTIAGATVSWTSSADQVATVSSSGLVRAIGAGNATITGSSGGKQDDAAVTVTGATPPPPPPPSGGSLSACETLPAATRTVNVSSQSGLSSALGNAQPGDRIVLAPGTYSGGRSITNRSGTQSQPIVLCGPRTAVLTGDVRPTGISWWIFQGFTIRDAFQAFYAKTVRNTRVQGLEIANVGQEAVHFACGSTDNVVEGNYIHDTGRSKPSSGEAVYLGTHPPNYAITCGTSAPDQSDRNYILDNRFGPNVTAEDVQVRAGTTGNRVVGNRSDGRGKNAISGHFEASFAADNNSYDAVFTDNVCAPAAQNGSVNGNCVYIYGGRGHVVRGNVADMTGASGWGFRINSTATNTICAASNTVTSGQRSNVACNAP